MKKHMKTNPNTRPEAKAPLDQAGAPALADAETGRAWRWQKVVVPVGCGLLAVALLVQSIYLHHLSGRVEQLAGGDSGVPALRSKDRGEESAGASTGFKIVPADPWWGAGDPFSPDSWDPFGEMQRMRDRVDQLFGQAFDRFERSDRFQDLLPPEINLRPRVDVSETDSAYTVKVDLPGAEGTKIETRVEGQVLHLSAETRAETEEQKSGDAGEIIRRERRVGRFERSVQFEHPVDGSRLTSSFEDGLLTVTIPKRSGSGEA